MAVVFINVSPVESRKIFPRMCWNTLTQWTLVYRNRTTTPTLYPFLPAPIIYPKPNHGRVLWGTLNC